MGAIGPEGNVPDAIASNVLAIQVARLFFERQLTKTEIASRIGISRFRVARLIDQALSAGLVTIEFREPLETEPRLARTLEERFGLDLCVVARGRSRSAVASSEIAALAAATLEELISPEETIGVAWGSTVAAVVDALRDVRVPGVRVVQLAGGSPRLGSGLDPSETARRLAARVNGSLFPLYAPAVVETPDLRSALLREPDLKETVSLFDRVSLALIGIGAFGRQGAGGDSALVAAGILTARHIGELRGQGAVGNLVLAPFTSDGTFLPSELSQRVVAITPDQIRAVPRVLAVAGGAAKARAIAGALATGVVKMLVTDEAAARKIVGKR